MKMHGTDDAWARVFSDSMSREALSTAQETKRLIEELNKQPLTIVNTNDDKCYYLKILFELKPMVKEFNYRAPAIIGTIDDKICRIIDAIIEECDES